MTMNPTKHQYAASVAREILRNHDPAKAAALIESFGEFAMQNTNAGRRYKRADGRLIASRHAAVESYRAPRAQVPA